MKEPLTATYLLVAASSFVLTILTYEFFVRCGNFIRRLFGMKIGKGLMVKAKLSAALFALLLPLALFAQTNASQSSAQTAQSPFELRWQFDTGG